MKQVARLVYYCKADDLWHASAKGAEGVGMTEREAIMNLEHELRDTPIRNRRRR